MGEERRGYFGPIAGLAADGAGTWDFYIARDRLVRIQRTQPESKYRAVAQIPEVLQAPTAIFQGLQRDEHEDGYAYVGRPKEREIKRDSADGGWIKIPTDPRIILVVFVTGNDRRRDIFDWEWRKTDAADPDLPENADLDFEDLLWRPT